MSHTHRVDKLLDKFKAVLRDFGIRSGDSLFVHSGYDHISKVFALSPIEVNKALVESVGKDGNLFMPSFPFNHGKHWEYVQSTRSFDVKRSPCRVGILCEIFRRQPDVARSLHPFLSVAGWGADVRGMLDGSELCQRPFGSDSLFGRLVSQGVTLLGLGCNLNTNVFIHILDDCLESEMPIQVYEDQVYEFEILDSGEKVCNAKTLLYPREIAMLQQPSKLASLLPNPEKYQIVDLEGTTFYKVDVKALIEKGKVMGRVELEKSDPHMPWHNQPLSSFRTKEQGAP